MPTLAEIQKRLQELKEQGYIPSKRRGPTGIGFTFEKCMGLDETNLQFWNVYFEYIFDMPEAKRLIKKISHPNWVRIGLVGCDWKVLRKECEKFCRHMEELKRED